MLTNIIIRIVIVSLLATASYGANASACKKRNAMKGDWFVVANAPLTVNLSTYSTTGDITDSVDSLTNFARLSLAGQLTFNNKSAITGGIFNDVQFDAANLLDLINYSQDARGMVLDRNSRYSSNNRKVTQWTKRAGRCYGPGSIMLVGQDEVDGNLLVSDVICSFTYRLDRSANNADFAGVCAATVYDPVAAENVAALAPISGSMIKKF